MAEGTQIGDVAIYLSPPAGYCMLDAALASDASLIGPIHSRLNRAGARLLAMSADCTDLERWRSGKSKSLDHWAEYQTAIRLEREPLPDTPEKVLGTYCSKMRMLGSRFRADIAEPQDRSEAAFKIISTDETIHLGVVAEEPLACFEATLRKFKTDVGTEKTQLRITASTILKRKIVLFYLFAPYISRDTVSQLLTKHRENVVLLHRENRD
jgi:hypothetical protein